MKTEIKLILEEGSSNKEKGTCFERLMRNLLSIHHYEVREQINYGGMEIDLRAVHKHTNASLYVECKAKEKVSSDELSKFCFNADMNEVDAGYFFRTQELDSQAGALLERIREKPKYKNLTFFEPGQILEMLVDANQISLPTTQLSDYSISKRILIVSYVGDFLIYLVNESSLYPTKFLVFDAKNIHNDVDVNSVALFQNRIADISSLEYIKFTGLKENTHNSVKVENVIETISEVQESENWYDPLPASAKHFVGRDLIRTQILEYFKEMQAHKSQKRVFYLNGKSGWGKSSLVLELKSRCRNKHYKNKFFTMAIDTRSATSDNFIALSFEKAIKSAINNGFILGGPIGKRIEFTSKFDLLSSESIIEILSQLAKEGKFLVLIFDQFEDVFRKSDLFKSFYKFLSDVTDIKPNLIVGFSWKTEIVIPIDHEAYFYWQQAKEQAREFTIKEFGEKEIDGIIKQLEQTTGRLAKEIKNRIKESSQGLPWLTKKLCIHILEQLNSGIKKDKLIEANLNIKELFEQDKERINGDELIALNLIAKKANEGNFFDISEVGETIENKVIESLVHKRLIIRSGANYNVYWDIFRDYLVTNEVPFIGESYILRQGVKLCLEVFLLFKSDRSGFSIENLLEKHPRKIEKATLENILIELTNIGLIYKDDEGYSIANTQGEISEAGFINFISQKFKNYTPYLSLIKSNPSQITKDDIIKVLKETFKYQFQDKTWGIYSTTLIGWFMFSNLEIKNKLTEPKKGRIGNHEDLSEHALPRSSPNEFLLSLKACKSGTKIPSKMVRDFLLAGIINDRSSFSSYGSTLLSFSDDLSIMSSLKSKIEILPKIQEIIEYLSKRPNPTAKQLVEHFSTDFFSGNMRTSKALYASKAMAWAKLILS